MIRKTIYLNTDLDLIAPYDPAILADALVRLGFFTLYTGAVGKGLWSARFEQSLKTKGPEQTITKMLNVIETLDEVTRRIWDRCTSRTFSIGYACGHEAQPLTQQLSAATIARIAAVGAGVSITLYPE